MIAYTTDMPDSSRRPLMNRALGSGLVVGAEGIDNDSLFRMVQVSAHEHDAGGRFHYDPMIQDAVQDFHEVSFFRRCPHSSHRFTYTDNLSRNAVRGEDTGQNASQSREKIPRMPQKAPTLAKP